MADKPTEPKPARAMGQLTADNPVKAGPTIVGGQPPREGGTLKGVPVGIERVLFLAAVDPVFKEALLAGDREAVVEDRGLEMKPSELAMLRFVPASQLKATIEGVDTSEENVERRTFMHAVAVGAEAVASAEAFSGCDDAVDGIRPDTKPHAKDATGIRPDMPPYGKDSAGFKGDMPPAAQDGEPPDQSNVEVSVPSVNSTGIRPGDGSQK